MLQPAFCYSSHLQSSKTKPRSPRHPPDLLNTRDCCSCPDLYIFEMDNRGFYFSCFFHGNNSLCFLYRRGKKKQQQQNPPFNKITVYQIKTQNLISTWNSTHERQRSNPEVLRALGTAFEAATQCHGDSGGNARAMEATGTQTILLQLRCGIFPRIGFLSLSPPLTSAFRRLLCELTRPS